MTQEQASRTTFENAIFNANLTGAGIAIHLRCDQEIKRLLSDDEMLCSMGEGTIPYDYSLSQTVTWSMFHQVSRGEA